MAEDYEIRKRKGWAPLQVSPRYKNRNRRISREEIDTAIRKYEAAGGLIKKLPEQITPLREDGQILPKEIKPIQEESSTMGSYRFEDNED
ncbi:MAG: hypothetical protein ABIH49_03490 [archaeon]